MKYFSNKKGFTLIELLVVIAIIGILTAIVTANFAQSKAKARDAKRISDLAQIQLTLEMIFDRCNMYPSSISNSVLSLPNICDGKPLGYFISKIPTDNGTEYIYAVNTKTQTDVNDYVLKAKLESNTSALTDAYGQDVASYYINGAGNAMTITCSGHSTGNYEYCVTPK